MTSPVLTIAMPAYDEIGNLEQVVDELLGAMRPSGIPFEILIAEDGSTDGTAELADRLATEDPEVRVVHHGRNRGIGAGWRTCASESRGEWVFLQPADGQLSPLTALHFYRARGAADVVVGIRGPWERPTHRRALSVGYQLATWVLLGVRLGGDHGACFLFRGELIRSLPVAAGDRGIAVLAEWLYLAKRRRATLAERPVDVLPRRTGRSKTGKLNDTVGTLADLVRVAAIDRVRHRRAR